jgi:16S rRNA G966 N2-methylase RsmD
LLNNKIIRPEPCEFNDTVIQVTRKTDTNKAAGLLSDGYYLLVTDRFSTGMSVLAELKRQLFRKQKKEDFIAYRNKRSEFYHASNRLLVPINQGKIELKKSPEIGWLEKLYPEFGEFTLTFPQIQGLNSSWQWYLKGITYPGLKDKIHPYYGTYFPTRFDHLYLFDDWLKKYTGFKRSAIDIGTGCGVLTFQMLNRGFEEVIASDINPNSIFSVNEHAQKTGLCSRIHTFQSDLFENLDKKADLVVFNPPWLPAHKEAEGLDSAIYYETGLFERFFSKAPDYIHNNGKLIILFSNLAESQDITDQHPVKAELEGQSRFRLLRLLKRKVKPSSKKTKRRDHRKNEFVELWELGL